jgi:hypothetical protein
MDVHESLSHTKWDCKYHSMRCSTYCDVCGVPDYAELEIVDLSKCLICKES